MYFPDYLDEEDFELFLKEARLAGLVVFRRNHEEVCVYLKGVTESAVYDLETWDGKWGWWKYLKVKA